MKATLEVTKAGRRLYKGVYEIDDNVQFWRGVCRRMGQDSRAMCRQGHQHRRPNGYHA